MSLDRLLAGPASTPVTQANRRRNAQAPPERPGRWKPARDRLWALLAPQVHAQARVAVVGAGNADDVPLTRLAARARHVDLIDLDGHAARRAIRREPRPLRKRLRALEQDVTAGAADRIVAAAVDDRDAPPLMQVSGAIGDGAYDVVVGDLLYSQLLYPALSDLEVPPARRSDLLRRSGAALTDAVVRRLHQSSRGIVVHLHDVAGWWAGHPQPVPVRALLRDDPETAMQQPLDRPLGCDPRDSLDRLGIPILATAMWCWPFAPGVDYLVIATVTAAHDAPPFSATTRRPGVASLGELVMRTPTEARGRGR